MRMKAGKSSRHRASKRRGPETKKEVACAPLIRRFRPAFSRKDAAFCAVIVFWPFLYLFRFVVPVSGFYTAIQQDFPFYYYTYKVYLLAHLANGELPLWSPSEASGYPFFSSPLTQTFYPLNLPLAIWYKLSGGYSLIDYQIFTISGLSIFGLGLFLWLRQLGYSRRSVLFSVLLMTISFRLIETLRFPNGIHTAAWYPWILYAMTKLGTAENVRKRIIPSLVFIFSTICLCTAGYPYFLYYSMFLFVPYFFLLLFAPRWIMPETLIVRRKPMLFFLFLSGLISLLICAPYLLAMKQLLAVTFNRSGGDYLFSTAYPFDLQDTIGSLIYPPLAQWEGWYFFSIAGVLLIILFCLICLPPFSKGGSASPMHSTRSPWRASALILIVWIAICSYISYGKKSYLFWFLWHTLPGFSSLRVWGRFNIILIPLFAWFLSMAYARFELMILPKEAAEEGIVPNPKRFLLPSFLLAYLIIFLMQFFYYSRNITDPYWHHMTDDLKDHQGLFLLFGFISFAVLFTLLLKGHSLLRRIRQPRWVLFLIVLIIALIEIRPFGTHMWTSRQPSPVRDSVQVDSYYRDSFLHVRTTQKKTVSFTPHFSVYLSSPSWYFDRYVQFYRKAAKTESKNLRILLGIQGGQRIFFSESLDYPSIHSFLADSRRFRNTGRMISYDGDVLRWEINAPQNGYLSFIDNYDSYWHVYVDGQMKKMELLFGVFKSVYLTAGPHQIEFRYEPSIKTVLFGQQDETVR